MSLIQDFLKMLYFNLKAIIVSQRSEHSAVGVATDQQHSVLFGPLVVMEFQVITDGKIFGWAVHPDSEEFLDGFPDNLHGPLAHPPGFIVEESSLVAMNKENMLS